MEDIKMLEGRINALAKEWYQKKETISKDYGDTIWIEMWDLVLKRYRNGANEELVIDTFSKAFEEFDPNRAPFCNYFSFKLKYRKIDKEEKDAKKWNKEESLNQHINDDSNTTLEKLIAAPNEKNLEDRLISQEREEDLVLELIAMVLNFAERHNKKQANDNKRRWYQIFYTEDITILLKEKLGCVTLKHEKDAWRAIHSAYLNYYMSEPCEKLDDIITGSFKEYAEVVPDDPRSDRQIYRTKKDEIVFWPEISLNYLRIYENVNVKENTRSTQRSEYKSKLNSSIKKYLD